MIYKSSEINKINLNEKKFILLYGKNTGAKIDGINLLKKKNLEKNFQTYEEIEILENTKLFYENIFSGSLFDKKKNIIINRATDKIAKIFEYLLEKDLTETTILVNANLLEKKSKLRSLFEKNKEMVIVPFYEDTFTELNKIILNFIKEKKIPLSQSNINLIINRCDSDRINLRNELNKIEHYVKEGKKISSEVLEKLTNLAENHSVNHLVDNCLAKNKKKTLDILNENNYNNDDCLTIIRTFSNKSKKILKLIKEYKQNNNIDLTISSAKPPIFWKDKEITKQQIFKWEPKNLKQLIYDLNDVEFHVKTNINNSLNIITNFILEKTVQNSSN